MAEVIEGHIFVFEEANVLASLGTEGVHGASEKDRTEVEKAVFKGQLRGIKAKTHDETEGVDRLRGRDAGRKEEGVLFICVVRTV